MESLRRLETEILMQSSCILDLLNSLLPDCSLKLMLHIMIKKDKHKLRTFTIYIYMYMTIELFNNCLSISPSYCLKKETKSIFLAIHSVLGGI